MLPQVCFQLSANPFLKRCSFEAQITRLGHHVDKGMDGRHRRLKKKQSVKPCALSSNNDARFMGCQVHFGLSCPFLTGAQVIKAQTYCSLA
jgi:hypothetical protein